jgi:hypothetical protein
MECMENRNDGIRGGFRYNELVCDCVCECLRERMKMERLKIHNKMCCVNKIHNKMERLFIYLWKSRKLLFMSFCS